MAQKIAIRKLLRKDKKTYIFLSMTPKRALKKAIQAAGSQEKLASKIGYTQAAISQWLNINQKVPAEAAPLIETAISGAVTRAQLRPDLFA